MDSPEDVTELALSGTIAREGVDQDPEEDFPTCPDLSPTQPHLAAPVSLEGGLLFLNRERDRHRHWDLRCAPRAGPAWGPGYCEVQEARPGPG